MLAAAVASLALSPAATAACEPPSEATVLARSAKVVVWRRDKQVSACVRRTGRRLWLFDLGGRSHTRIVRMYLFGERVVVGFSEHGDDYENRGTYHTKELVIFRLRGQLGLAFLDGRFGDIPEMVRDRDGRFAWIVTRNRAGDCPCSVRAGDTHEDYLVTRRREPIDGLRLHDSSVSFDTRGSREHVHVPFVDPRRYVPDPDPGGRHARFELKVPLPGDLPADGRFHPGLYDIENLGTCHDAYYDPRQEVTREPGRVRIVLSRVKHWCRGWYEGVLTYRWGDAHERGACGPAHPNCAGYLTLGRFTLRVDVHAAHGPGV
ncbi:MAG: hypothetical protein ACJ760_05720 [Thermoleophilaceae bacterium]